VRNSFWGPNSEEFDPSRLKDIKPSEVRANLNLFTSLSVNDKEADVMAQLRYNLHSFGIGSRKCMGQFVAGHIVKSLVVYLFDRFEVQPIEKERNSSAGKNMGSWTPKSDALLRFTRREGVF
jgi:cytochrome P450